MANLPSVEAILNQVLSDATTAISNQLKQTAVLAALELRNSALSVLGGQRSGRRYLIPGTHTFYTASAPGEAPAVRTGALRLGWTPSFRVEPSLTGFRVIASISLGGPPIKYAPILDPSISGGSEGGLNRPFVKRIQMDALPRIQKLIHG